MRVDHHALSVGTPKADAIARVLDCEHVHLELVTKEAAKPVGAPQILGISVEVNDDETGRLIEQEQARHAVHRLIRGAISACTVHRHPNKLARKTVDGVARGRAWKQDIRHDSRLPHHPEAKPSSMDHEPTDARKSAKETRT
mmetsp:Transcript_56607/g.151257  ORF Transcript_56607/g.151257 Transcript_56607/m.151257 type:complete len:142 (-) Transcript_56607:22-447(-)